MKWLIGLSASCLLAVSSIAFSAETLEQRKAVALRVFEEIFNQGKSEIAAEIYAEDLVNHGLTRKVGLKEDQDAARGWKSAALTCV